MTKYDVYTAILREELIPLLRKYVAEAKFCDVGDKASLAFIKDEETK